MRGRDRQHPPAGRADEQGWAARGWPARPQLAVAGAVVRALEVDGAFLEQCPDDRERLLEAIDPVVERDTKGAELGLVPAGAEPQDEAPTADLVERVGLLGEDGRVVECRARDERAQPDRRGRGGDRG